jgi:FkbM family methyltransferase
VVAYPQVAVHPYAAFSENCQITFHDYGVALSAFNSALTIRMAGDRVAPPHTEIMVTARRIDDLLGEMGWDGVDVIKIDAESSEAHVLFGLERTIRESHPAVIAEMGDYGVEGSLRSRQMIDWFTARGYAVCEAAGTLIAPHHPRQDYGHENLLFLTDEHRERVRSHGF